MENNEKNHIKKARAILFQQLARFLIFLSLQNFHIKSKTLFKHTHTWRPEILTTIYTTKGLSRKTKKTWTLTEGLLLIFKKFWKSRYSRNWVPNVYWVWTDDNNMVELVLWDVSHQTNVTYYFVYEPSRTVAYPGGVFGGLITPCFIIVSLNLTINTNDIQLKNVTASICKLQNTFEQSKL